MNYAIYKLHFPKGVHFGQTTLESAEMTFQADRLFSALCTEAVSQGGDALDSLVSMAEEGKVLLSDAFPYEEEEYFLPKPLLRVEHARQEEDIGKRKLYKNLSYLPLSSFSEYLEGRLQVEDLPELQFGGNDMKVSVQLEPGEEAVPYRIGTFSFREGCGLYILVGYERKEDLMFVEGLLESLSFSGIGGRRSTGMGRFELRMGTLPKEGIQRMDGEYSYYMNLSVALPEQEELARALEGARYLLEKRSGFVASERYAPEPRRKRDVYAFQAGSCFPCRFRGQIRDVSNRGQHPVYRYLKPIFMGIGT